MTKSQKVKSTTKAWEDRELGASEEHVKVARDVDETAIDRALELHPISIRLQHSLIEDLKNIARIHGIGYQPLMRQVLNRFVECEKKRILREQGNQLEHDHTDPDDDDGYSTAVG